MLEVRDLWVHHGSVAAVRGVSFDVADGEVVALVGANGAGKTSTVSAIAGLVAPSSGEILYRGRSLVRLTPEARARAGIALVPEGRHVFATLTVEENLRLAMAARRSPARPADVIARATAMFPALRERLTSHGALLSGGEQQQLAIARALVMDPDLLLLDEPSLGLAPAVIDSVFDRLQDLKRHGQTALLVEQKSVRAAEIADRVMVLARGEIVDELTSAEAKRQAVLAARYFAEAP